jgi:hypothetical protein
LKGRGFKPRRKSFSKTYGTAEAVPLQNSTAVIFPRRTSEIAEKL